MNSRRLNGLIGLALVIATLAVYGSVHRFDFVKFDDDLYVYNNPHVAAGLTGEGIRWALAADFLKDSPNADFWIPLTFISHMLAAELFGMEPAGHHVMNLVLHVLNTLLLFLVLRKMTAAVWPSAFVAALFSIHPLHVESVAWVTERKDVLSAFFLMLTLLAYGFYREKPGAGRYGLVAVSFALGLMAKPMLVTLPLLLILVDFWPLERFKFSDFKTPGGRKEARWIVIEKIPLLLLSFFSSAVTFLAVQREGVIHSLSVLSPGVRLGNTAVSYAAYIEKTLWPRDMAPFYPYSPENLSMSWAAGSALLLLFITAAVFRMATRRPYLFFGWLWFLVSLLPVIG
ncbi:MAG TPA: hypothetical protein VLB09_03830, partial [Nitrospiria bacterium]|nr:hypothetical protein [Nitrospiria bacterium]